MEFFVFVIAFIIIAFFVVMMAGSAVLLIAIAPFLVPVFGLYLMSTGNVVAGVVVLVGSIAVLWLASASKTTK